MYVLLLLIMVTWWSLGTTNIGDIVYGIRCTSTGPGGDFLQWLAAVKYTTSRVYAFEHKYSYRDGWTIYILL